MLIRQWIRKKLRKKQRIYILPTRMGGYFNGLIFLMFLLSIGYSNNLLLIFTLFLFGMNLIWLVQTHFHLHALAVQSVQVEDGHAGEPQIVHFQWKKTPRAPHAWDFALENDDHSYSIRPMTNDENTSVGEVTFDERGFKNFIYLRVRSEMPFGLYQTWCYYPIETRVYVYPKKLKYVPPMDHRFQDVEGEQGNTTKGPHDFWALAPYLGEESKRISWKHYAKSGELVVKEGEENSKTEVHFILPKEAREKELILSQLATQMTYCHRTQVPFSFDGFRKKFSLGSSEKHLKDCLKELALC